MSLDLGPYRHHSFNDAAPRPVRGYVARRRHLSRSFRAVGVVALIFVANLGSMGFWTRVAVFVVIGVLYVGHALDPEPEVDSVHSSGPQ